MKLKKLTALAVSALLTLSLAACSGSTGSSSTPTPPTPPASTPAPVGGSSAPAPAEDPSKVKIGIIIPGSPTDGGFSQLAAEAGKKIEETYGYTVSVVQAGTAEKIRTEGEEMAANGYKIVFGHGGQCSTPLAEICADYPETWFITTGGTEIRDNQFPICLNLEEGTYVAGVIAGLMTKTNVVGYTLGGDYPAYSKTTNGFELGAKSVNPDIKVLGSVLSSPDANECYETTLNQVKAGADFIYSNSNEGQAGAMKAVSESKGVYIFGSLGDFIGQAPESVILNVLGDWPKGFIAAVDAVMRDTVPSPAEIMFLTLDNACVTIQWNETLKATLPADVIKAAEQAMEDIKSGKIDVPNEYELG